MRIVIGAMLVFALAAPVAAQDWQGHISRSGAIVVEPAPPDYPGPYPFPHVDYYPGRAPDPDSYPSPPPSPEEQARRYPSWFYCDAASAYFPYVKTCATGWTTETAARPPGAPNGPAARWFYCEAQKTFSPYVDTCPGGWKEIAAAPQPIDPRFVR